MNHDEGGPDRTRGGPRPFFRGVRAAAAVLTRFPVGGFPYDDAEWRWSVAHLPLVGAAVGWLASVAWAFTLPAGPLVASVVAVATAAAVTGAFHEDGLADTADALGGGNTRERVFAILKDPGVGSFGVTALVLAILFRVAALERLASNAPSILSFVGGASRLAAVALMTALPYVTPPATAKSLPVARAGVAQAAVGAGWVAAVAAAGQAFGGLTWAHVLAALAAAALATTAAGLYFRRRVGGVTGDFLGATQQLSECVMLLTFAVLRGDH